MKVPRLHFKHVYGGNPHEWGFVGFPSTQKPQSALSRVSENDLVLLAVTQHSPLGPIDPRYSGRIFGVSTLLAGVNVSSRDLANPNLNLKLPEVVKRWKWGTPLLEYANAMPMLSYAEVPGFVDKVRPAQGRLFQLDSDEEKCVWAWLCTCELTPASIYRSPRADELLSQQDRRSRPRPKISEIMDLHRSHG